MKDKKNIIIALLVIIIVILGGLYFFNRPVQYEKVEVTKTTTDTKSSDVSVVQTNNTKTLSPEAQCEADLVQGLKDDNADYEKGSVIVTFLSGVTFADAKTLVQGKGFAIQDESTANANFVTNHRFIVTVPSGKEFSTVCSLRKESIVKYAGVNELFQLHQ